MLTDSRAPQQAQRQKEKQPAEAFVQLTPEGAERLQNEIEYLQKVRLPIITEWIRDIASDGFDDDVAEYERAQSEFDYLRRRIREIDDLLSSAEMLVDPIGAQVAQLGSRVTVTDGKTVDTYRIVGRAEADPARGFISDQSPVGKAVLDRCKGDQVVVETPDGAVEFHIVEIA